MIELSFNEYSTLLKRAAHGVAIDWGYCDDFAFIGVWLNQYVPPLLNVSQLDINQYLANFLLSYQRQKELYDIPDTELLEQGIIQSSSSALLNSLQVAVLLFDLDMLKNHSPIEVVRLPFPLLLLPYCYSSVDAKQLMAAQVDRLILDPTLGHQLPETVNSRVSINSDTIKQLQSLMMIMCVPETAASLKDAG